MSLEEISRENMFCSVKLLLCDPWSTVLLADDDISEDADISIHGKLIQLPQ